MSRPIDSSCPRCEIISNGDEDKSKLEWAGLRNHGVFLCTRCIVEVVRIGNAKYKAYKMKGGK